ncbi:hypothetical protein EJ02DRAFT_424567 [Clathrospora elynae]|uniref:Uncharacterized protein n=1 Tax=Clathrospora elynae TaxID=706981 RepID=A0A6A5SIS9_9PLEO|nr:hypothetical protein EJ02DRAFT_424567 [Clathrospora elynae]
MCGWSERAGVGGDIAFLMTSERDKLKFNQEAPVFAGVFEIKVTEEDNSRTFIISTALLEKHTPKLSNRILERRKQDCKVIKFNNFSFTTFDVFVHWLGDSKAVIRVIRIYMFSATHGIPV